MEKNNPLYKNQGIHLISSIFTVKDGNLKVLLIKRNNEPFKDKWALVGGALYNTETVDNGMKREIVEKTGIEDIDLYFSNIFSDIDRSPVMRMIAISYVGLVDYKKLTLLKQSLKTTDCDWFDIKLVPDLAYDHNKIFNSSIETLRKLIDTTNIMKSLFNYEFTIPEIQNVYETILNKELDRRNFRKKLLQSYLIIETNNYKNYKGNKPAKLYKFR